MRCRADINSSCLPVVAKSGAGRGDTATPPHSAEAVDDSSMTREDRKPMETEKPVIICSRGKCQFQHPCYKSVEAAAMVTRASSCTVCMAGGDARFEVAKARKVYYPGSNRDIPSKQASCDIVCITCKSTTYPASKCLPTQTKLLTRAHARTWLFGVMPVSVTLNTSPACSGRYGSVTSSPGVVARLGTKGGWRGAPTRATARTADCASRDPLHVCSMDK